MRTGQVLLAFVTAVAASEGWYHTSRAIHTTGSALNGSGTPGPVRQTARVSPSAPAARQAPTIRYADQHDHHVNRWYESLTPRTTQVSRSFSTHDFDRKARPGFPTAAQYPAQWVETRLRPLAQSLEVIRGAAGGREVHIHSGYREPRYNAHVGGAHASQHMEGRAADISISGMSAAQVHRLILDLIRAGQLPWVKGVGVYDGHVHIDVRPTEHLAHWNQSSSRI